MREPTIYVRSTGLARRLAPHELEAEARGKWAAIYEDLAPVLAAAMAANGDPVVCPVKGVKKFRFFDDWQLTGGGVCNDTDCGFKAGGLAMLAWALQCPYRDAVRMLAQWLRGEHLNPTLGQRVLPPPRPPKDRAKARAIIRRIWMGTLPIAGTAAERYLLKRGIWPEAVSSVLRFHPGLRYYDRKGKYYGTFPVLVAPITNAKGEIIALLRIFVTEEGEKAPVPEPKKMTSCSKDPQGAAIKLYQPTRVLGVGEGVETMSAVRVATHMPVWPVVNAVLLEHLLVPDHVEHVVIWEDKDLSGRGRKAALVLSERLIQQGKSFEFQAPPQPIPASAKSIDWLDVLNVYGIDGFPERWRIREPSRQAIVLPHLCR